MFIKVYNESGNVVISNLNKENKSKNNIDKSKSL